MTAQELAQQILDRIKEADKRVEESDPDFWRVHYVLVVDVIEKLCKEQLLKEPVKP